MNLAPGIAADFERFEYTDAGQRWTMAWHPATAGAPSGMPHGSAAVCTTPAGDVVLVSEDGLIWQLPGGRPEGTEDWRETLGREVLEEACATILDARLLGFARSECIFGPQSGVVLVRSLWRAEVFLDDWLPRFEMSHRRVLHPDEALPLLTREPHPAPIYRRLFREAL